MYAYEILAGHNWSGKSPTHNIKISKCDLYAVCC